MTKTFYDELAPYYHLLYPDWEASMVRQSHGLAAVLQEFGVPPGAPILDAACGIGTQALGLSMLGYQVTASDLAPAAVARASREAESRGLHIAFSVADLRELAAVFSAPFAAVLACDNAVPHLLSDREILRAFSQCHRTLAPGGVLLISVRDYAAIERRSPDVRPYGSRTEGRCLYFGRPDLAVGSRSVQPDAPPHRTVRHRARYHSRLPQPLLCGRIAHARALVVRSRVRPHRAA